MKKRALKKLLIVSTALILVFLLLFMTINAYVRLIIKDKILLIEDAVSMNADCILILGAGVWEGERPKPTYLGDSIPVSGDGNATNDK